MWLFCLVIAVLYLAAGLGTATLAKTVYLDREGIGDEPVVVGIAALWWWAVLPITLLVLLLWLAGRAVIAVLDEPDL
jgi:hypothetical protein